MRAQFLHYRSTGFHFFLTSNNIDARESLFKQNNFVKI